MYSFFFGCDENKAAKPNYPVFVSTIMPIPTEGIVKVINGDVFIKKNDINQYNRLLINDVISIVDIIEVKKDAEIEIAF